MWKTGILLDSHSARVRSVFIRSELCNNKACGGENNDAVGLKAKLFIAYIICFSVTSDVLSCVRGPVSSAQSRSAQRNATRPLLCIISMVSHGDAS